MKRPAITNHSVKNGWADNTHALTFSSEANLARKDREAALSFGTEICAHQ